VNQGLCILFQIIAVISKFLLAVFKEGAGNGFLYVTEMYHVTNVFVIHPVFYVEVEDTTL
jgi:hypothetical protein